MCVCVCVFKQITLNPQVPEIGGYVPSHAMRSIVEHSGLVGDTISWTITARSKADLSTIDEKVYIYFLFISHVIQHTHKRAGRRARTIAGAES